jgi:F-type H+-transporting ATPase subunit gamma
MAKARKYDKRRASIRNIRKITRTMELIATARFKRAMDRAVAATAYTERITTLVGHLAASGQELEHPLMEVHDETAQATLLVLTANRGMCGGYNVGVLRLANERWKAFRDDVPEVRLEVSGNRGISAFRFRGVQPQETFNHFEDRPTFEEVELLADRYLADYEAGRLDRLDVAYTKFEKLSRQGPVLETLLPLGVGAADEDEEGDEGKEEDNAERDRWQECEYEFLPSAKSIVDELVPASFKAKLFKCFLDAAVSEQIARMMAMKAATENADGMIENLSMAYNRARQGQITDELLEVIAGAEALNK